MNEAGVMLDTKELAERWKMKEETIVNWRTLGKGPPFIKLGDRVLYRRADVERWEEERLRGNG